MAISGLSVFGGGGITQYIDDGATAKQLIISSAGIAIDVQEKGIFTAFSATSSTNVEITIDGVTFSGPLNLIVASLAGTSYTKDRTVPIPYFKSLKVNVTCL